VGWNTIGHDCRCVDQPDYGPCPFAGVALALLIGRVGDGESFVVGAGGDSVASQSGDLWLAVNDNDGGLFDNAGAFHAIVTVFED